MAHLGRAGKQEGTLEDLLFQLERKQTFCLLIRDHPDVVVQHHVHHFQLNTRHEQTLPLSRSFSCYKLQSL